MLDCFSETASGDQVDLEPDHTGDGFNFNTIFIGETFTLEVWFAPEESFAGEHPLMRIEGGVATYYLQDAMGSVVGMAGSSGSSVASIKYDGFGNVTSSSGASAAIDPNIGFDFRLHGMALDAASGLYHVRARTYDPRTGRFTSRDPFAGIAGRPESTHPYLFSHQNPHVWIDPTGQMTLPEVMVVAAITGVLAGIAIPSYSFYLKKARAAREASNIESNTPYAVDALKQILRDIELFEPSEPIPAYYLEGLQAGIGGGGTSCRGSRHWWNNFVSTNEAIPGLTAPSLLPGLGLSTLSAGHVAELLGTPTFLQWWRSGFPALRMGASQFTKLESGVAVGGAGAVNFAFVTVAYEAGVLIGTTIVEASVEDYCGSNSVE